MEDTVVRFVSGRMTAADLTAVEAHARGCVACERLLSTALAAASSPTAGGALRPRSMEPTPPGTLERGTIVDRYTILSLLGRGGMSEVYAAYDPKLDRRIALKLLLPRDRADDARAEARLLREAQVVARLSHPNVISVHDVGAFGDRVYLAMEYVEGHTLSDWLVSRPRTRDEVLAVFADAARGLAAAHAAGLVHRDFKPQNVMVAGDGHVRVADFGLARRLDGAAEANVPPTDEVEMRAADATLTQTGELVGTPLYMAPEQFLRRPVDARTDQFSFCVALYQALYAEHPFHDGGGPGALIAAVTGGHIRPAAARTAVPVWLRRVLVRGLASDPAARWPSMEALTGALSHDPMRRRRRLLAGAVAGAAVLAGAVGFARVQHAGPALCHAGPSRLADSWTGRPAPEDPRRRAIETAFMATGLPTAKESWDRVAALLDRYAASWLKMYRDSCEATHLRGEQSAEVLDLRTTCLEDRHQALKALTDVLASADKQSASKAIDAVNALPSLDRCSDVNLLRAVVEPPKDPMMRARVDDLRRRAAETKALFDTGRDRQALGQARALVSEARALGYLPLTAELLLMSGWFASPPLSDAEGVGDLEEAVRTAIRSRRDDIAAEAATDLVFTVGYFQQRTEDGARWADLANALLDRIGEGRGLIKAWLLNNQATMLIAKDPAASLRLARQSLELKQKLLPLDSPDIGHALINIAEDQHRLGDDAGALETVRRAEETYAKAYGPTSTFVAQSLSNQGEYLVAASRPAEALPLFRQALPQWEAQVGPDSPFLGYPLTGIGRTLVALGRPREAQPILERALRVRESGEPDPEKRAETRFALAKALWATGDRERSIALAEEAAKEYAGAGAPKPGRAVQEWLAVRQAPARRPRPSH